MCRNSVEKHADLFPQQLCLLLYYYALNIKCLIKLIFMVLYIHLNELGIKININIILFDKIKVSNQSNKGWKQWNLSYVKYFNCIFIKWKNI